ncbi:HalOD1 output domain-containing protein [Halorarum salinum]|uniref:Halobacterial output domain-containing protein n=1 Tax=Halorarum salinum TaxID=2743089 RepID=A0A7D5QGR6_9EURY|nr:HalOD1 output domain-containing protein [Halobaculum salinum]QLG62262.1 hypothetical protein HUG12_11185 [Halobaculum salinum]
MHERRDDRPQAGGRIERAETLCPFHSFEFRSETNAYEARYDAADVPASIAVIGTMAVVLDREPERLDPLGDRLDIESLDGLLAGNPDWRTGETAVSFDYLGHEVTVRDRGTVTVREPAVDDVAAESGGRVEQPSD